MPRDSAFGCLPAMADVGSVPVVGSELGKVESALSATFANVSTSCLPYAKQVLRPVRSVCIALVYPVWPVDLMDLSLSWTGDANMVRHCHIIPFIMHRPKTGYVQPWCSLVQATIISNVQD